MDNNKAGTMFGAIVVAVNQTEEIRDFYKQVIGWDHIEMNKGDYTDYRMTTADGQPVAGIHHQAGVFDNVPPIWIATFFVSDLRASLETCKKLGGKVLMEPMNYEKNSGAVIEYPAGAICGLCQM